MPSSACRCRGGPTRIAVATLIANIVLDALFYRPFGVWGIPFATSFVNIIGTILLSRSLKPVVGPFITPRFRRAMLVIVLASAVLAGVSFGVWYGLDALLGRTLPAQIVSLLFGLGLGGLAYLWTTKRLGVDELRALHQMRRSRTGVGQRFSPRYRVPPGKTTLPQGESARDLVEQQLARAGPAPPTRSVRGSRPVRIASILRVSPKRRGARGNGPRLRLLAHADDVDVPLDILGVDDLARGAEPAHTPTLARELVSIAA